MTLIPTTPIVTIKNAITRRSKVLAKLTNARCALEDALHLAIPAARYDPSVMPDPMLNRLSAMIDDLNGGLRQIEGSQ